MGLGYNVYCLKMGRGSSQCVAYYNNDVECTRTFILLLTPASVNPNPIQDFSTPSLEGVLARDNLEEDIPSVPAAEDDNDQLEQYQIVIRRQWEHKYVHFFVRVQNHTSLCLDRCACTGKVYTS